MSAISNSLASPVDINNQPLQDPAIPAAVHVPTILNNTTSLLRTPAQIAEAIAKRNYETLQTDRQTRNQVSISNDLVFAHHRPQMNGLLTCRTTLCMNTAGIVADYVLGKENPFGAKEWERYFGVDVGPEPELPKSFYEFWRGPDPIDPTKQVCDTHLPPVLRPRFVTHIVTHTSYFYGLNVLGQLMQNPKEGNPSGLYFNEDTAYHPAHYSINEVTPDHGLYPIAKAKAGPARWLVVRKNVLANNQTYTLQTQFIKDLNTRTKAEYEEELSVIDLATVAAARYVFTGERYLGDNGASMLDPLTYSSCKDTIEDYFQATVGGFALVNGSANLQVEEWHGNTPTECLGIAALRSF